MDSEARNAWEQVQLELSRGGFPPPHGVVCYSEAAREWFCTVWTDENRIEYDELELLIRYFFRGIEISLERVDRGSSYRRGWDVTLETFPLVVHYDCGEDPGAVKPVKELIIVSDGLRQRDSGFVAEAVGSAAAEALAVGLSVWVRQMAHLDRHRLPSVLERARRLGATER
jgi:hypothetical protein